MHLTHTSLYALRLSLNQSAGSSLFRRTMVDRSTTSALFLATLGLSLSMFSVKQLLSSPTHQHRMRRFR